MAPPVQISAIVEGLEMQSDELHFYLHRPTGRILPISEEAVDAAENDEEEWVTPEELAEARAMLAAGDEYLALPDRFEVDEYRMMERFARKLGDDSQREALLGALHGRGAFRRFRDTAHDLGVIQAWYDYRDECYRRLAREWCEAEGVEFEDSGKTDS